MRKRRLTPIRANPTWNAALMRVPLAVCSRSDRPFRAKRSTRPTMGDAFCGAGLVDGADILVGVSVCPAYARRAGGTRRIGGPARRAAWIVLPLGYEQLPVRRRAASGAWRGARTAGGGAVPLVREG